MERVLILGAGPAGVATALTLRQRGVAQITLLHRPLPHSRYQTGESASPDVAPLLRQLELPQLLEQGQHWVCRGIRWRWGGAELAENDYMMQGRGHGWHLNRHRFDEQLRQAAEHRGIDLHVANLTRLEPIAQGGYRVTLSEPGGGAQRHDYRVLVDASGRGAHLAGKLGVRWQPQDRLTAYLRLGTLAKESWLKHLSYVEATPHGWWFVAGIPGDQAVVVFLTDVEIGRQQGLVQGSVFDGLLAQSLWGGQGVSGLEARVRPYAAHVGWLPQVVGRDWVAVGDAALGLDPLSASGINGALADGIAAGHALADHLQGDAGALTRHGLALQESQRLFVQERQIHYGRERRWCEHPFWQRRHLA
ncbi:FAD dependent oxidoreductase [Magnetococcus marinus MC-1]|uniref:FAD dependent oxidoreductase n=1 Tax=Magnetococcus marinus (strain ATCC BAA-1437 / JCM 17883 / MC-1) TaxID=156889 RepID=A0L4C5_MAGMM|nr:tryptophan 7-halogenase [Magnetococcus marinus]ABK42818.1 FAD dependent oxidoreductase [Magnetococcus marinus MC-1]